MCTSTSCSHRVISSVLQCNDPYHAQWELAWQGRCPNLVPSEFERQLNNSMYNEMESFRVTLDNSDEQYDSLAHMWSSWYRRLLNTSVPRLIIRHEDILFHADEIMAIVADCVGTPMNKPFKYFVEQKSRSPYMV